MAEEFSFQELIFRKAADAGFPLGDRKIRLVRHENRGRKLWALGRAEFEHWVSFQSATTRNPYNQCDLTFQFIPAQLPEGRAGALFVGAYQVHGQWVYEGMQAQRQPLRFLPDFPDQIPSYKPGDLATDLVCIDAFEEFSGRVLIQWSPTAHGTRTWSQWWNNKKPIVEIRTAPIKAPFPGFQAFRIAIDEVELMPPGWRQVLSAVSGVYLLVCQDTGQQYVGSAHGAEGMYGRWLNYARTGHGGNKLLKARKKHD
jgi:hypothetical protein